VDYGTYIAAIRDNVDRLVDAAEEAGLHAPVPSTPGWNVDDLLVHVASEAYTRIVESRSTERPPAAVFTASPPPGDRFERAREHGYALADALEAVPEDTPVWTFSGPGVMRYWARRAAHEMVIHRCDAELANGSLGSIDADLAADGVDEYFEAVDRRLAKAITGDGETLHFHCTDRDVEWLVTLTPDGLDLRREHAKGDVAVRATANAMMLLVWNRIRADNPELEVFGDRDLLVRWQDRSGI
jgi:uncharacterized protein (TIGR03083 family)